LKVALIGGGNCYAINLANYLESLGIEHFGIGRSPSKHPALWMVDHPYRYFQAHLIHEFDRALAILDSERPEVLVSFAAQGESAASFGHDADLFYATNTLALVRLAEALRERTYLRQFVQIGTSECYGSTDTPARETDPVRPTSPYAISKVAFDLHLEAMYRVHGFPMNIVRPSNCFTKNPDIRQSLTNCCVIIRNSHQRFVYCFLLSLAQGKCQRLLSKFSLKGL